MRKLEGAWLLEARYPHTCGIHTIKHVPNHAIFTASVHRLQHHEHAALPFGIEEFLQLFKFVI